MASTASTVASGSSRALLADAGAAAADVDRGHRRLIENDSGDAGRDLGVVGVADADAGDIGEEIFQEIQSASGRGHIARASRLAELSSLDFVHAPQ